MAFGTDAARLVHHRLFDRGWSRPRRARLQHGYRCVVTARDPAQIADIVAPLPAARAWPSRSTSPCRRGARARDCARGGAFRRASTCWSTMPATATTPGLEEGEDRARSGRCSKPTSSVLARPDQRAGCRECARADAAPSSPFRRSPAWSGTRRSGYYGATKFAVEGLSAGARCRRGAVRNSGHADRARAVSHRLPGPLPQCPEQAASTPYAETAGAARAFACSLGKQPGDPAQRRRRDPQGRSKHRIRRCICCWATSRSSACARDSQCHLRRRSTRGKRPRSPPPTIP